MRSTSLLRVLAGLLVVSACTRDVTVPAPVPNESFVSGRIVEAVPGTDQSRAVPGATVAVLGTNLHALADDQGTFVVGPLPESTFQLFVSAKTGDAEPRQRLLSGVETKRGATHPVGDVTLGENAILSGRALLDSQPVGNAGVVVFVPATDFVTSTSDSGGWLLRQLPPGVVRVSAYRTGFTPATTADIDLQGGIITSASQLVLLAQPASASPAALSGAVLVMGAADNAGATVRVRSVQGQAVAAEQTTPASGEFAFTDLAPGLYSVEVQKDGYPRARVPNLALGAGVTLELQSPLVLAPEGPANVASDATIGPGLTVVDAGTPPSTDGGAMDGGATGACLTDDQCPAGLLCVGAECVNCSLAVACKPGFTCHTGSCLKDCVDNSACPGGQICAAGSCGPCQTSAQCNDPSLVCTAQGACAHCSSRAECPAGKACLATGCGACSVDADCGAGALCEQGACVTGTCRGNADCPSPQACVNRQCAACSGDAQCRTNQLCLSGTCTQGDCRGVLDCPAGEVCLANLCGACAQDADCGAGQLCFTTASGKRCGPGACRVNADCTGASLGLVCNASNQCAPCASTAACGDATKVCDTTTGRCLTGNCVTAGDCAGLGFSGLVCASNACAPCTADAQCGTGQLCISGKCKTATCTSNAMCSSGTQICELGTTNPVAAQYTCRPCAPLATLNSADCGGAGHVCDALGTCHPGTCVQQSNCANGLACVNFACAPCATDAQCGGNGLICVSGACLAGVCHGTAPDPNADCPSTQVCISNLCVGNCRTSADCAGTAQNPGTSYCDPTTHACSACTASSQCGFPLSGKVCGGGACTPAQCTAAGATPNDAPCSQGQSCVAGVCVQLSPVALSSTFYAEPQGFLASGFNSIVSGASRNYFSNAEGSSTVSVALDSNFNKLWSVVDNSGSVSRFAGPFSGGMAVPAPGFPGGELFVSPQGLNGGQTNFLAHRADTGAFVWVDTFLGWAQAALSMVGGVPQLARSPYTGTNIYLTRVDGTKGRTIAVPGCAGYVDALVAGTSTLYAVCDNGVIGFDPINDQAVWTFPMTLNGSSLTALWRPPTATGDVLVVAHPTGANPLLALYIPDNAGGSVPPTVRFTSTTFAAARIPMAIDANGGLFLAPNTGKLVKLSMNDGSLLANPAVPASVGLFTAFVVAADGTLIGTSFNGLLSGVTVADGVPGTASLKWQLGGGSLYAPMMPAFPTLPAKTADGGVVDGGVLAILQGSSNAWGTFAALVSPGSALGPKWPAWNFNGDPAMHNCAPAYQCTQDSDCAATQSCLVGRCVGSCRVASTCTAGQGCQLGQCGACSFDTACRGGEVCNGGMCFACDRTANPSCCSTTAECGTGNACVQGLCRAAPNATATGAWIKSAGGAATQPANHVIGTDGTTYVLDATQVLRAFGADGTPLWTSAVSPAAAGNVVPPMIANAGGQDVLIAMASSGQQLITAPVSAAAFGAWHLVSTTALGFAPLYAAQGVSSASGAAKPALYLAGAGHLAAVDVAAAAAGTLTVLWNQPISGCTEPTTPSLLVGSDGTLYHVCNDSSVQAWGADGTTSQPVGLTRPGALLWTSTTASPSAPGNRHAMGQVPGGPDVLYVTRLSAHVTSVLRVAAAGVTSRVEAPAYSSNGVLVNAQGQGVALGSLSVAMLSPAGQVSWESTSAPWNMNSRNALLTTDGLLWMVDGQANPTANGLEAIQVNPVAPATHALRLTGPGGLPWDAQTGLSFLTSAQTGTSSGLLITDMNLGSLGYANRAISAFPVPGATSLAQWGVVGGDAQHRYSLKTQ